MRVTRPGSRSGQSGTEYMMLISVVVIGVTYAAYTFIQPFENGVEDLGNDVKEILSTGSIGGVGRSNGSNANAATGGSTTGGTTSGPGTGTMNNQNIVNSTLNSPVTKEQQEMIRNVRTMHGEPITFNTRTNGGDV
jgi:hypothetical protein